MERNVLDNFFPGVDQAYEQIHRFHSEFGLPSSKGPCLLSSPRIAARAAWIQEEVSELRTAASLEEQVDALMDIMYLALGCLVEMGVRPGVPLTCVHQTNLQKRWPDGEIRVSPEGKLIKPPDWTGPEDAIAQYLSDVQKEHPLR